MKNLFANVRGDITGGITAGVVALPLALALGVASGVGPMAGMYGAIAVGFFAALFGGTPSQISGPTGPMVVVLAGLFASLSGNVELIFTAVLLAGLFQILFGFLGIGNYIRLVPYPVISGFMSGIGAIIIILQIGHEPPGGTLGALGYIPTALADINFATLALGVGTLVIAYKWPASLGKYVPGALAALIIGTLVSLFITNVPILGDIPTGLPSLHLPTFESSTLLLVLEAAFILAILGAIDSLLTSLVADNMTRTRHDSSKELIGQGIGNTVAGLIGGIAGAGATMRTVVNIRSGGKERLSGMVHAMVLLAVVMGLSPLASAIPHAVLAGILVKVGLDIVDWSYLKRAHSGPRWDFALMLLVLGLTVFVDLITAVGVGVVLAALAYVRQIAQLQIEELKKIPDTLNDPKENALLEKAKGKISIFSFGGPLSFGAAADLGHHVREWVKPGSRVLILDFSRVPTMDVSASMAVGTVTSDAKNSGRQLMVCGASDKVREVLDNVNASSAEILTYPTLLEALESAVSIIEDSGKKSPKHDGSSTLSHA